MLLKRSLFIRIKWSKLWNGLNKDSRTVKSHILLRPLELNMRPLLRPHYFNTKQLISMLFNVSL